MAATLTKKTKKELHSFVMEVLSTYDVDNKLVQKFIGSIAKDINAKYGQLNEKPATQGGVVENVFNAISKKQVKKNKEEAVSQYEPAKEKSNKFLEERPVEFTSSDKQPKNIFQQLLKEKDKGLIGITQALLKQRETANGEKTSYFNKLKESATSKTPLDNAKGIMQELFKPFEKYSKKLEEVQVDNDKLEALRSKVNDNESNEQQLDLIKDEESIQSVSIDKISPDVFKNIQTAIESGLSKAVGSSLTAAKKTSNEEEGSGSGSGILGTLVGIKYLKDLFKSKIPAPGKPSSTRPTTKEPSSKKTSTAPSKKENVKPVKKEGSEPEAKTANKKKVKTETKEALETEAKPVSKESTKVGAKEVLETSTKSVGKEVMDKEVVKAGTEVAGKETAKVGAKALGKSLLKKIPGVGLVAGIGAGAQRALSGDWAGAGLEFASGAASTIPGYGTAASFGLDALIAGRDAYNANNETVSPEVSKVNNMTEDVPSISPTPPTVLPADTPAQKFTPIQEPAKPVTDKSSAILETIAANTNNTNSQIANLTQAILKLAGALGNSKTPSIQPLIIPQQQAQNNSPSMSQIASNNFDPIRAVRSNFAVA